MTDRGVQQRQRREVYERDKGVCSFCGMDTDRVYSLARYLFLAWCKERDVDAFSFHAMGSCGRWDQSYLEVLGLPRATITFDHSLWGMEHVIPVCEGGGGDCGLANLATLCIPCHKRATAALRARLARKERRDKRKERREALSERYGRHGWS